MSSQNAVIWLNTAEYAYGNWYTVSGVGIWYYI